MHADVAAAAAAAAAMAAAATAVAAAGMVPVNTGRIIYMYKTHVFHDIHVYSTHIIHLVFTGAAMPAVVIPDLLLIRGPLSQYLLSKSEVKNPPYSSHQATTSQHKFAQ